MKILHITNYYKPSWDSGGVTRVVYDISTKLVENGHEVTVYTTDGFNSRVDVKVNTPVNIDGVRVYYFYNLFQILARKINLPTPYYLPFILRKEIKSFAIIHIHEHRTLSAIVVHYYAKKHGVPYVLQSHGSVLPFLQKEKFKNIFDFFFGRSILKNATKVIALNEDEGFQYQRMGVEKRNVEIITNGINLDDLKNVSPKGTFKIKHNISEADKVVLYVGRIHKNKGIDLLMEAVSLLSKKIPNIRLVIIGPDNGFQHELEDLAKMLSIEKNVIFTGFVAKDVKMAALIDADVFVTPNFSGFPMSFLEAGAFGLPIITTIKGDNLDWIHNKVGYVVQYNKDELCNAIFSVLNDSEITERFGIEIKNLVENRFSMSKCVQRIEALYKECVVDNCFTSGG